MALDTNDFFLLALAEGEISEEEYIFFQEENTYRNGKQSSFPYKDYQVFDWNTLDEFVCKIEFRFEKTDIPRLKEALRIPEEISIKRCNTCGGLEALCILLKRFAYPVRYCDMVPLFARSVPELCRIVHFMINFIYEGNSIRLRSWNLPLLSSENLQLYAHHIHSKGAPLTNCFGFIDGTVKPMCRPEKQQRDVYNGHKRVHCLKFQSICLPNGLIANLSGPWDGRRHDAFIFAQSGVMNELEEHGFAPDGSPLCIYGDPAYPLRVHLQTPFRDNPLTDEKKAFNKAMSSVRVSVEWVFGEVVKYFKYVDFKKALCLGLSPVGKFYVVSALLQNARTCLYGNIASEFFGLNPPSLEEYFTYKNLHE